MPAKDFISQMMAEGRYCFSPREAEIFSITKWHYERFTGSSDDLGNACHNLRV